jgi:zinc transport system permease protein
MVFVIALVVALAMKLLGAFLVDSLLILPVLTASSLAGKKFKGIKKLFLVSSIAGLFISVSGYLLAIAINWPPSASISLVSGFVFLLSSLKNKISFGRKLQ